MAQNVLTNAKIILSSYDLSGDFNQVAVAVAAEELDDTAFGDSTRTHRGGLLTGAVESAGYWNGGADLDKQIFDRIGTVNVPILIAPTAAPAGDPCYFMQAMHANYQVGGQVAEILPFSLSAQATGGTPIVRGHVLYNDTATATEDGTAYELGAVAAGKKLYAALFVTGVPDGTNPTLDVVIESDVDANFDGSETARITFAQQTARNALFATPVAGAITDTFWRATVTIGGTDDPAFAVIVVMGIL